MFQPVHGLELVVVEVEAAAVVVAQKSGMEESNFRNPAVEEELISMRRGSFWRMRASVGWRHPTGEKRFTVT